MSTVLLLRAANQDGDQYEHAFMSRGYHPISVPVLETVIIAREELAHRLSLGAAKQDISGVIITSKRAVEAWREAQALLVAGKNTPPSSDSGMFTTLLSTGYDHTSREQTGHPCRSM